MIQVI